MEVEKLLVHFRNPRDEVNPQERILRFQNDASEAEEVLDDTVLDLLNILDRGKVNALVVVEGEQCPLDAVHPPVREDDDIEEVSVEPREEDDVRRNEERHDEKNEEVAHSRIINFGNAEECPETQDGDYRGEEYAERRPDQPNPVLSEVKSELFLRMLPGKGDLAGAFWKWLHQRRRKRAITAPKRNSV